MGAASGRSPADLIAALREDPGAFGFFQAVRLLEAVHLEREPSAAVLGEEGPAQDEGLRLASSPSMSQPVTEVRAFDERAGGGAQLRVGFFGLLGSMGVLPQHYTELVSARRHRNDEALRDFLDFLEHRALSLFYRAWLKQCFPYNGERHAQAARSRARSGSSMRPAASGDALRRCLDSLLGMGTASMLGRTRVPDESLLYYSGLLSAPTRSALGLEELLCDYFEMPFHVEQFVGRWLEIPAAELSEMPSARHPRGRNCGLGTGLSAGKQVWDVQSKVRLVAGPLSREQFQRIAPHTLGHARLFDLARRYLGTGFDFDLEVRIARNDAPRAAVGGAGSCSLGVDSWVIVDSQESEPCVAVYILGEPEPGESSKAWPDPLPS